MRELVQQVVAIYVEQHRTRIRKIKQGIISAQQQLELLQQRLNGLEKPMQVFGTDVIEQAWNSHPQAPAVFARYHLNACDQCAVRFDETVHEAALAYGFSEEAMLVEINILLREEQ